MEPFLYGLGGGCIPILLSLFQLRERGIGNWPDHFKTISYWLITAAMVVAGGILVVLYHVSGIDFKPLIAVNIGAAAPGILAAIAANVPAGKTD